MIKGTKITKKKIWAGIAIIFGIVMLLLHAVLIYDKKISELKDNPKEIFKVSNEGKIIGDLQKDNEILQTVSGLDFEVDSLEVCFGTFGRTNTNTLNISFENADTKEIIGEWSLNAADIIDNAPQYFEFGEPLQLVEMEKYLIRISSQDGKSENSVTAYMTEKSVFPEGELYLGGELQKGDLAFAFCKGTKGYLVWMFILIEGVLFALLAAVCYGGFWKKWKIERMFAVTAILLGVLYMLIMPPYSAPDEQSHINTSYYFSSRLLFQEGINEDGEVLMRQGDQLLNSSHIYSSEYVYSTVWDHFFEMDRGGEMTAVPGSYVLNAPSVLFLPQTLGITLARILHFGCIPMLYLGRLFALLFYVLCGYLAIKKIPFGKLALFFVALLPISAELAASFSYDSVINGIAFLFIGYCLYLAYEKEKVGIREWLLLAALMAVLAPSKIVYVLLALLCLLIPRKKAQTKKKYYMGMGIMAAGTLLPLAVSRIAVMTNYISRGTNTVSYAGKEGFTVAGLLQMPMALVRLVYDSFKVNGEFYLQTQLGGLLSWLYLNIPWNILICFLIILVLSCIMEEKEKVYVDAKARTVFGSTAVLVILALAAVFLLTWTTTDAKAIQGIQGRYFTPILPLILFSFRSRNLTFKKNINYQLILGWCIMQYYTLWTIFETILAWT